MRGPQDLILSVKLDHLKGFFTLMIGEKGNMIRRMPILCCIDGITFGFQFVRILPYSFNVGFVCSFYSQGTILEFRKISLDINDNHTNFFSLLHYGRPSTQYSYNTSSSIHYKFWHLNNPQSFRARGLSEPEAAFRIPQSRFSHFL